MADKKKVYSRFGFGDVVLDEEQLARLEGTGKYIGIFDSKGQAITSTEMYFLYDEDEDGEEIEDCGFIEQ